MSWTCTVQSQSRPVLRVLSQFEGLALRDKAVLLAGANRARELLHCREAAVVRDGSYLVATPGEVSPTTA
jgi:hypothetical protein